MSEGSGKSTEGASGLLIGDDGLVSERTIDGDMALSMMEAVGIPGCLGPLGASDIARDMSRTRSGRMCFPSDFV